MSRPQPRFREILDQKAAVERERRNISYAPRGATPKPDNGAPHNGGDARVEHVEAGSLTVTESQGDAAPAEHLPGH